MATASMPVSLPSIHEMFPEHLLKISPAHRLGLSGTTSNALLSKPPQRGKETNSSADSRIYSFDVLRSDPSSSSLQHIASSATLPNRVSALQAPSRTADTSVPSAPAFRVRAGPLPRSPSSAPYPTLPSNSDQAIYSSAEELSDDGDDKKHVCATCHKRFNRPSSLRIHMNTHTGATPFRCPYPNCGREFNVNSNMRRHYRNHSTPVNSRSQGKDDSHAPRKRKRTNPSPSVSARRQNSADDDFLVLRPGIPMHSPYEKGGWSQPQVSPRFFAQGKPGMPAEASDESDADSSQTLEEDELMDDDHSDSQKSSSYRLQPVSDFSDRYSSESPLSPSSPMSRYSQSDVRSLVHPSPPPSSPSSLASISPFRSGFRVQT